MSKWRANGISLLATATTLLPLALVYVLVFMPLREHSLLLPTQIDTLAWLFVFTAIFVALLAFATTRITLHFWTRPLRELAGQIALSAMAEIPFPVKFRASGPLAEVTRRYNDTVAQVQAASEQLRQDATQAQKFAELVLAQVPLGVLVIDLKSFVTRSNPAAEQIFGQDTGALVGQPLSAVLPATASAEILRSPGELRVDLAGRGLSLALTTAALHDAQGEHIGHILIAMDRTEVRQLAAEVELKRSLAQLGEMAAGLAHDLRNPLAALRGFVELIDRRIDQPDRLAELLPKVAREADALSAVVGDFLTFARPAPLQREDLAAERLLTHVVETTRAVVDLESIDLHTVPIDEPVALRADRALLYRALVNLCVNACQAAGEEGQVELSCRSTAAGVAFCVDDSGPGIPESQMGQVTEPLFTTKGGGSGIGLAVVQRVADLHGGQLQVERSRLGGARFILVLPQQTGDRTKAAAQ